ncbi:MAG: aminomethyl-transferring glycine dehydrogenase [Chitinophagales bacterium]|nr:aminomethyl-transferring glycine dehydrogenase [Chitinophagales bacterium]
MASTYAFSKRHIGISAEEKDLMLKKIGVSSLDELIDQTIPSNIRSKGINLPKALTEFEYLNEIKTISKKNKVFKSYIGMGYYGTITPAVIRRNVFENPGWYTQYTPYQAEIAQGRLESLLNFQTVISDLTALPIANASLLDDATAAAETMNMFFGAFNKRTITATKFFVDEYTFPQIIDILQTRANPLNIEIVIGNFKNIEFDDTYFGALVQYPNSEGKIEDYTSFTQKAKEKGIYVGVVADILSLAILTPPGEWGADCVIGNTQRFGVPMGFGGPHAAYMATTEDFKRIIPGRIIGISTDRLEKPAYRMALQTREQHIRREKATSNICTAQALLANMAAMYAVHHGYEGIKEVASNISKLSVKLAEKLSNLGFNIKHHSFFDTIVVETTEAENIKLFAEKQHINFFYRENEVQISLDETTSIEDVNHIAIIFEKFAKGNSNANTSFGISTTLQRTSKYLQHEVFKIYRSETELMRYIKHLENKDLSLTHSMIPLGSCTMKLNAAAELEPVSWDAFANIHPFAPTEQTLGYQQIIKELESFLSEITGFHSTSVQPNSGAQGEFAGLLLIQAYHQSQGDKHRNIVLIPESAHGTNPASAVMAGCQVVVVKCDTYGNIDKEDLQQKAEEHKNNLSSLMITYPSTHGVFEHHIKEIIEIVHANGGQVYMDGANMNAQVGFTSPGEIGADVCHLNLHKTFAIPHGGGGPGVGPICCAAHLSPFLPSNALVKTGGSKATHGVAAAPYGSASILLISYAYIKMLGAEGLTEATQYAILNANYIKAVLEQYFEVLYTGKEHGKVAHELILDFRPYKHSLKIEVEDVAKRLMDYGFHAPTVSFPVAGTLMIEPTESEGLKELNRFCDAMISIKTEIDAIANGDLDADDNPLKNAPHTMQEVCATEWTHKYDRETAAFPCAYTKSNKFWPTVSRVNNSVGDRNLICTCPPVSEYAV